MMMMNLLLLPADITTEILSRLPAESVIECKRVCKTWRSIIDEPTFGDAHTRNHLLRLDHSSSSTLFFLLSKHQLPAGLNRYVEFHFGKYNINAAADDDDQMGGGGGGGFKISKPLNKNNTNKYNYIWWYNVHSSNGLICLILDLENIYIYNLLTNEYVNLHPLKFKTSTDPKCINYGMANGFGYDPCTNEYKVVFIFYYIYEKDRKLGREVRVYTLGSGTWRIIQADEEEEVSYIHYFQYSTPGVHMNGALHWLRRRKNGNYNDIVSFDLADEKFRSNIIMPLNLATFDIACADLGLLGGCLCMTQHNLVSKTSDIWVMNNRDKFWTMKFKITQKKHFECYSPVAGLGNGRKILLLCRKTEAIALYDIETGNIDYDIVRDGLNYSDPNFDYIKFEAIPYVKSFVSLKALGEKGARSQLTNLLLRAEFSSTTKGFYFHDERITHKKDVRNYSPIARLGSKLLLLCRRKRKTSETIASYDIETGNIDYDIVRDGLKYLGPNYYITFKAIPFVKSFVSLKALGEEGAKNAK